ncbi:hypothetical protein TWF569_001998 [Orbilia oligospora]|uniref:Uncharacterized protein n=1 Tax=Orbilia oligospora TaxID=2813651 RepID=A0A7C8J8N5_ORBOL|nr:hypothetical protein TWF103_008093 [Orbilia oligospora]KAF3102346.1 hypothetical protein TWF102_004553 [Orbilia oligospora]KAF3122981.1 hypothetical protein TWF569_001998 [Orbilia oligospora]
MVFDSRVGIIANVMRRPICCSKGAHESAAASIQGRPIFNVSINLLYKRQRKIPASSESLLPSACLPAVSLDEMSPIGELDVNIFCSCTSTLRLDSDHDSFEAPEAASSHSYSSKLPIAVRHR